MNNKPLTMSRRGFFGTLAALVAAPLLPAIRPPAAEANILVEGLAAMPLQPMWACGTPGEYDWHAFSARTAEEAFHKWREYVAEDDEGEHIFDPEFVQRVPKWDGKKPNELGPADWFAANMGHCCERCGYETSPDQCGRVINGEVVCEECLTITDRAIDDPDALVEDLANRICDKGEDDVRAMLEKEGGWPTVEDDIWPKALIAARDGGLIR